MKINEYGTSIISPQGIADDRRSSIPSKGQAVERVSISSVARHMAEAREMAQADTEIRSERVREARMALADGSLFSDEALDKALERLLPELL